MVLQVQGALIAADPDELSPLHFGGRQERGLRPGTEDVAGAAGLAEAVRLAVAEQPEEEARLVSIRDEVESRLCDLVPELRINAAFLPRAPHILSLAIRGVDSDFLLAALDAHGRRSVWGVGLRQRLVGSEPGIGCALPQRRSGGFAPQLWTPHADSRR